jgi:hypothetical protein
LKGVHKLSKARVSTEMAGMEFLADGLMKECVDGGEKENVKERGDNESREETMEKAWLRAKLLELEERRVRCEDEIEALKKVLALK